MPKGKLFIPIISGIAITILFLFVVNWGIELFYPEPEYNYEPINCVLNEDFTECIGNGCVQFDDGTYQCDYNKNNYDSTDRNKYNQTIFYIYVVIAVIFLAIGLSMPNLLVQIIGLGTGYGSAIIGMIRNSESTLELFITSIVLIIVTIFMIYKFNKKYKWF